LSKIEDKIAVIGLGYVGLPLAVALSKKADVVGFDVNARRVAELKQGIDKTKEVDPSELQGSSLEVTTEAAELAECSIYIVTVPTPIDEANRSDFTAMLKACDVVGSVLSQDAVVVFESTVYPGVTEEICGPALERASKLKCGTDFMLGYSPERINPGDKQHSLEKITKVVAGQDAETLSRIANIYGAIIEAGIHQAPSIKVAEAAKVLENTQRDVNIALMNEVSKICDLVGIRSHDVLAAAGTKWNFLKFHPGLVGGHCIGVDPYYLTAKAEELGYHPEVILSGRRINDSMGSYVAQRLIKLLSQHDRPLKDLRVGILGLTFKENVPDIRNSKVVDIYRELQSFGLDPLVHDPLADPQVVHQEYSVQLSSRDEFIDLDALILAVSHLPYMQLDASEFDPMLGSNGIFVDVKSCISPTSLREDIVYWSL
jgi:UDP-N-acetyl-D-galactosamine dehydrogenase